MLKLLKIQPSPLKMKKLRAYFNDNTYTDFGQKGASDYTKNHDEFRKTLYINRHMKRENWNDPKSAGALSKYILWNKKTIDASIANYKKQFRI